MYIHSYIQLLVSYPLFFISLGWGKGCKKTVAPIETACGVACGLSNGVCISEMRALKVNPHLSPTKSLLYPREFLTKRHVLSQSRALWVLSSLLLVGPFGGLIIVASSRPLPISHRTRHWCTLESICATRYKIMCWDTTM